MSAARHSRRVDALLQTNESPSVGEYDDMYRIYTTTSRYLSDLDDLIGTCRPENVYFLIAHRQRHSELVANYKLLVSPIRRIPTEILHHVFHLCAQGMDWFGRSCASLEGASEKQLSSLRVDTAPWNLTHVCSRWRHIALAHPSIWTSVAIDKADTFTSGQKELLQLQLERSGEYPLSICVRRDSPYFPSGAEYWRLPPDPVLSILLPSCRRWRELFLAVPPQTFDIFYTIPRASFSQLETVFISDARFISSSFGSAISHFSYHPPKFLLKAPQLRTFLSTGLGGSLFGVPGTLQQWACIRDDGKPRHSDVYYTRTALMKLPGIRSAQIKVSPGGEERCDPLTHNYLEELEIQSEIQHAQSSDGVSSLLRILDIPSLHSLAVVTALIPWGTLARFIERSACLLTVLDLFFVAVLSEPGGPTLEQVLQYVPALDTLRLTYNGHVWNVGKALAVLHCGPNLDENPLTVVPQLRELSLTSLSSPDPQLSERIHQVRPMLNILTPHWDDDLFRARIASL